MMRVIKGRGYWNHEGFLMMKTLISFSFYFYGMLLLLLLLPFHASPSLSSLRR